jgi:hypothetical protein
MGVPLCPMAFFVRHPPNIVYRGAILLGCLAFLLGVSGIFYFQHLDARGAIDEDTASVLIHGVEGELYIQVVAEWEATGGALAPRIDPIAGETETSAPPAMRSETGRLGDEAGVYLFQRAPEGVPLELIVYRYEEGGRVELHRQLAILTYGQSIYTAIPSGSPKAH